MKKTYIATMMIALTFGAQAADIVTDGDFTGVTIIYDTAIKSGEADSWRTQDDNNNDLLWTVVGGELTRSSVSHTQGGGRNCCCQLV